MSQELQNILPNKLVLFTIEYKYIFGDLTLISGFSKANFTQSELFLRTVLCLSASLNTFEATHMEIQLSVSCECSPDTPRPMHVR